MLPVTMYMPYRFIEIPEKKPVLIKKVEKIVEVAKVREWAA